jgi:enamine deaminase RidA (YjgF/YER057c/UK114 family)
VTITRHKPGPRNSQAVVWNGAAYLAGQVSLSGVTTVGEQTHEILSKIDELLRVVGSDKSRILSATVYLADISTAAEMNEVWERWVDPANPPARATIEARLARPELLVEIMSVAALSEG